MQIGIDLGATKIESVLLDENGEESFRERINCPKNYIQNINAIKQIVLKLDGKLNNKINVGVCHPGIHSTHTGLVKNAPNCYWIEKKPLQKDLRESLKREVYCENDANCFTLSEAIDGSCKNYKIVFGVILGSGCGGGLVINKKIQPCMSEVLMWDKIPEAHMKIRENKHKPGNIAVLVQAKKAGLKTV